jgi:hypothetical protein
MSAHPIIAIIRLARATVHALAGNSCTRPHIAAFGEINACPYRRDPQFRASAIVGAGSQVRWPPIQSGQNKKFPINVLMRVLPPTRVRTQLYYSRLQASGSALLAKWSPDPTRWFATRWALRSPHVHPPATSRNVSVDKMSYLLGGLARYLRRNDERPLPSAKQSAARRVCEELLSLSSLARGSIEARATQLAG